MSIQSQTASFTGSEDYVDLTWDDQYDNFKLFFGVSTTDDSAPAVRMTNPSNTALPPANTGVRVEPTAPFTGEVYVVCLEVLP